MAKLIYGMHQSLDGYVDHMKLGPPGPAVFQHFIDQIRGVTGVIYGRKLYEIMRYWEEETPNWDAVDREFAAAWQSKPKWVVSRSLQSVGPNATLITGDVGTELRKLKGEQAGEIRVGGPDLAQSLTVAGVIDEYQLYIRPVALGSGTPFFAGPPPTLRLLASDLIGEDVVRLTYAPS